MRLLPLMLTVAKPTATKQASTSMEKPSMRLPLVTLRAAKPLAIKHTSISMERSPMPVVGTMEMGIAVEVDTIMEDTIIGTNK